MNKNSRITQIVVCVGIVLLFLFCYGVFLGPLTPNLRAAKRSATMQQAHAIGLCLSAYAQDHNGHYPEGKTSTEVFQKLLDGNYVTDPKIFYAGFLEIPRKVPPESKSLKQENVCWDVTCCVDSSAPNQLPVVFQTGFKVTYQPGTAAMPVDHSPRTWNGPEFTKTFIAVSYASGSSMVKRADDKGEIPDFISSDFDPKGKTYQQLTP